MIANLFTLIDDIAAILDDVSVMTKVAAKQAAGVAGDDLALGAQQVAGMTADRELPVIYAVAKGALINKVILVPSALIISAVAPWSIIYLLMIGGLYLCLEGFEKVNHHFNKSHHGHSVIPEDDEPVNEADKINGAIRTDMVLSGEIIVITLGAVAASPFITKIGVLTVVAIIMTFGIYGLVALIIKLDDMGLYLLKKPATRLISTQRMLGRILLNAAPKLMKFLSVAGTVAMFLVGGGLLMHNIPWLHHVEIHVVELSSHVSAVGGILSVMLPFIIETIVGMIAGALSLILFMTIKRASIFKKSIHSVDK